MENRLGQTLRQLREERGKSVVALAEVTGIDKMYIYRLEKQDTDWLNRPLEGGPIRKPSRDLIIRLAIAIGLDLDTTDDLLMLAGYAPLAPYLRVDRRARMG